MSMIKLMRIKEATNNFIATPKNVYEQMRDESRADRECLWVLHVNCKNRVIEKELAAMGSLDAAIVSPREIFRKAVMNSSSSIIVVHNHPSGDVTPSSDDKAVALNLRLAGKVLGIELLDFIIIGDGYFSFREQAVLDKANSISEGQRYVIELQLQGLSFGEIAKHYRERFGAKITHTQIKRIIEGWLKR